jgi:hypothetical protein
MSRGMLKSEDYEPELGPFVFYFDAFQELSSCRHSSFGPGPIPFTAIAEYSTLYDIEDRDEFHYLIRIMDNSFLKLENKKKQKRDSNSGPTNPGKANSSKGRY